MNAKTSRRIKLSKISTLHYIKLVFRSALFLAALVLYIVSELRGSDEISSTMEHRPVLLIVIGAVFTVEMILRFFPSSLESMGCQKQFARNYLPEKSTEQSQFVFENEKKARRKSTAIVIIAWVLLNSAIGALYFAGVINKGALILISLAYSVCDMICILFFCPFQTLMMKNKCCGSCRIYNWDYAMMFTPLIFIPNLFTWTLLALSIGLLIRWEVSYHKHPERFSEATNASLSCAKCQEKLCVHKTSLQHFLKHYRSESIRILKAFGDEAAEVIRPGDPPEEPGGIR